MTRSRSLTLSVLFGMTAGLFMGAGPVVGKEQSRVSPLPVQGLQEVRHAGLETVMIRPGVDLRRYGKVMIAPVDLSVSRESDDLALQPRDVSHAREYFARKLQDAFGENNLASQAGPGVLELKVIMTEFVPNSPAFARRQDRLGGQIQQSIGVGRAAFQAVLTDSQTGQVVAALADADEGQSLNQNVNARSQYGDADRFIRRWAKDIARLVENGAAG